MAAATALVGGPAEVVLDIVGTDATIAAGLGAVAPYGAFGLVGAGGGTFAGPWFGGLPRDAEVFTFQGSSIADVHAVVELAEAGRIASAVDRYPLARVGRGLRGDGGRHAHRPGGRPAGGGREPRPDVVAEVAR